MTTRHFVRCLVPVVMTGLVGCGGKPPAPPAEPSSQAPVIAPLVTDDLRPTEATSTQPTGTAAQPTQPTKPAMPAEPPVTLPFDSGGKAVAKALVLPSPLPAEGPLATKPKAYTSALDRGELPLPPVVMKPFGPTEPKGNTLKPSPPAERYLPTDAVAALPSGRNADRPPAKALSPTNSGAADVQLNAWRQGDRAPLEDPTSDLSAARVIETPLPMNTGQPPFLRAFIPNPFEYADQLKGRLGKETELGSGPIK